jgi:hypothetical protein
MAEFEKTISNSLRKRWFVIKSASKLRETGHDLGKIVWVRFLKIVEKIPHRTSP